jgi:hypothetical protein
MAATTNQPIVNPYAQMPISQVVELFNALPHPEVTDGVQSLNHWHFSPHSNHFIFLYRISSPTEDYQCAISNLDLDSDNAEEEIVGAMLRCMLHQHHSLGVKPWLWSTNNQSLRHSVAVAMQTLGVDSPLSSISSTLHDDKKECDRCWERFRNDYIALLQGALNIMGLNVTL